VGGPLLARSRQQLRPDGCGLPDLSGHAGLAPADTDRVHGAADGRRLPVRPRQHPFGGVDPATGARFLATTAGYSGDGACAAPYFSGQWRHRDFAHGVSDRINGGEFDETWLVRAVADPDPDPVHAPANPAQFGLALAAILPRRR
jgi:hypothetical protein